jgi:hypothetical protein
MISVLVTGATTPMGERLVRSLISDTRVKHVLAVDDRPPDRALPFSHGKRLTYKQVDLRKSRRVHDLLFGPARDLGVEVIVHLSEHRGALDEGRKVRDHNVEALRSMLDLANRHPTVRRLVVKSHAVVYRVSLDLPILVSEDHPLAMGGHTPQYVRDRVEADLTACASMGLIDCEIVVLRCAEALAPGTGSQLHSFLSGPVAFRPLGFDPMVNVATIDSGAGHIRQRRRGVQHSRLRHTAVVPGHPKVRIARYSSARNAYQASVCTSPPHNRRTVQLRSEQESHAPGSCTQWVSCPARARLRAGESGPVAV